MLVLPTEALLLEASSLRLLANLRRVTGTVRLTESVTTSDKRNSLIIIHGHAAESGTNVPAGGNGVRDAVRSFRVDINETHVGCTERLFQVTGVDVLRVLLVNISVKNTMALNAFTAIGITSLVAEPSVFSAPVH